MEQITCSLAIQDLITFCRNGEDISALLHNFFAPGTNNYQRLVYELQREFKQGGSPDVTAIKFDRVTYNAKTYTGSFRIVLDINFTFGCEDVTTENKDQTSEWTFEIDMDANTIHLYSSPFAEARSTADEF